MRQPAIVMALFAALAAFGEPSLLRADSAPLPQKITVTVQPGARQTFHGLGVSEFNYGTSGAGTFNQLTPAQRALLWRLVYHDLHVTTLRLWYDPRRAAPTPGVVNMSGFVQEFVTSGLIRGARQNGVKTLLLAPDHVPPYLLQNPANPSSLIRDDQIRAYAVLLATMIQQVKQEGNVALNATGIANEPPWFTPAQMVQAVIDLRQELNRRGLQQVKIVAPESPNNDGTADAFLAALKASPQAWAALGAIATHSYNMAARPDEAAFVAGTDKGFWITEAGGGGLALPGSEGPDNGLEAASMASRFLNDMNEGVTRWIWFIGVMDVIHWPQDDDNVQRLIEYQPHRSTDWYLPLLKYYYLRQLSETFPVGTVFRHSISSLDGEMTYTYGRKPRVNAAAARNPDGTWSIALSNFTSDQFLQDMAINRDNAGALPQAFAVTVVVPELAHAGNLAFTLHRCRPTQRDSDEGQVWMRQGRLTVSLGSTELITLHSVLPRTAER